MTNSPEFKLAKFLDSMIKPYNPNTYMLESTNNKLYVLHGRPEGCHSWLPLLLFTAVRLLESTSDFLTGFNGFKFSTHHKLVSFDIFSLFTNVPLDEQFN